MSDSKEEPLYQSSHPPTGRSQGESGQKRNSRISVQSSQRSLLKKQPKSSPQATPRLSRKNQDEPPKSSISHPEQQKELNNKEIKTASPDQDW